jgi:hypothetical protein
VKLLFLVIFLFNLPFVLILNIIIEIDQVIRDEALRCLSSVFGRAAKQSLLFVEKVDPGSVQLFLNTVYRYIDDGDEGSKIAGRFILWQYQ